MVEDREGEVEKDFCGPTTVPKYQEWGMSYSSFEENLFSGRSPHCLTALSFNSLRWRKPVPQ
jgi:hypothetical protein